MSLKLNKDRAKRLLRNRNTRMRLVRESLFWFGWYYFRDYFTHKTPDFHMEMTRALQFQDREKYLLEIMFKDSAKTSWARIAIIWRICNETSHFICYVCHDQEKSKAHLFDIAIALQTNKKLIADYGQLFYEDLWVDEKRSQKKSIKEFITANRIKVKAYSTGMSIRGELYEHYRPDYINVDDIENVKTKDSPAATQEVIEFLDEMFSGITAGANVTILANRITKKGSIAWLEKKAANNPDFKVLEVPLIDENGKIAWSSRFVNTDSEAQLVNALFADRTKHVFSIEERRRTLGTRKFNQEYRNIPVADDEGIIKRQWIEDHTFNILPFSSTKFYKVIMMDPQSGESKSADFFGISVIGWYAGDSHRYLLEVQKGRGSQMYQAATLIKTWMRHRTAKLVGIEKLMTQVAIWQLLVAWKNGTLNFDSEVFPGVESQNRNMPLKAVEPQGKDKVARLQVHEPAFERGEVHLHHTMKNFSENLIAFPDVEHDDDVDSMIYCLDYSYKSSFTDEPEAVNNNTHEQETIVGNAMTTKF